MNGKRASGMLLGYCRSRVGGSLVKLTNWIPACAGMTTKCLLLLDLPQLAPSLQQGVWVERHGLDADLHQPLCEVEMVGGALAADADIFAFAVAGLDGHLEQGFNCIVAFVESVGDQARVAI